MARPIRQHPDVIRSAYAGRDKLWGLFRRFPNMPEDKMKLIMEKIRECDAIIATSPDNEPWELEEILEEAIRMIGDRAVWARHELRDEPGYFIDPKHSNGSSPAN